MDHDLSGAKLHFVRFHWVESPCQTTQQKRQPKKKGVQLNIWKHIVWFIMFFYPLTHSRSEAKGKISVCLCWYLAKSQAIHHELSQRLNGSCPNWWSKFNSKWFGSCLPDPTNIWVPSLKLTAKGPENRPNAQKGSRILSLCHHYSGVNC